MKVNSKENELLKLTRKGDGRMKQKIEYLRLLLRTFFTTLFRNFMKNDKNEVNQVRKWIFMTYG